MTLAGVVETPAGDELTAARDAHLTAVRAAKYYIDYSDFTLWVLRVHRVRWVGGYGRMESATGEEYAAAAPDPVAPRAAGAIAHLNADHADSLAAMAGCSAATPTPRGDVHRRRPIRAGSEAGHRRGVAYTRVGYAAPIDSIRPIAFGDSRAGASGAARLKYDRRWLSRSRSIRTPTDLAGSVRADPDPRLRASRRTVQAGQRPAQPRLHRR